MRAPSTFNTFSKFKPRLSPPRGWKMEVAFLLEEVSSPFLISNIDLSIPACVDSVLH